jgi:ribosomal protein S8E
LIVPFTIPISSTVNDPSLTIANNTNTTIITNTANIIDLKKWVDIDGNGSDADLTSWDVSHVNEPELIVPFTIPISSTVNDPSLTILLKLNVIVLATVFAPPLPVIQSEGFLGCSI